MRPPATQGSGPSASVRPSPRSASPADPDDTPRRHRNRERHNSARRQQHNREHTTRSADAGFVVLTVRSGEPHEERAAMSWYSRPRQCGEVALQERAMIRGPEPYHPRGRMRPKSPENAGFVWSSISGRGGSPGWPFLDAWPSGAARRARPEVGRRADPGGSRRF
jgi:hypothetical protein